MRTWIVILALACLIPLGQPVHAQPTRIGAESLGWVRSSESVCPDSNLYVHHDGTFEFGIAWSYMGVEEPYGGAFGEAYELPAGTIECVSLWHSSEPGYYNNQSTDVYVWDGGVSGEPGAVLGVVSGIVFEDLGVWPEITRHDVPITVAVSGPATVGSWGNWVLRYNGYFWMVDYDGPGYPWTHVAPFAGYPEGWQHPETIWGLPIRSMGIAVHFTADEPVPARESSWGEIKQLYSVR